MLPLCGVEATFPLLVLADGVIEVGRGAITPPDGDADIPVALGREPTKPDGVEVAETGVLMEALDGRLRLLPSRDICGLGALSWDRIAILAGVRFFDSSIFGL